MKSVKSQYPHIEWLDLADDGVLVECAIMKKTPNGDVYYFPVNSLDEIDRTRLFNVITNRNAKNFELWDLMSNITLGNGMNALIYFHQMVRVRTPGGKILDPQTGRVGAGLTDGVVDTNKGKPVKKKKKVVVEQEDETEE